MNDKGIIKSMLDSDLYKFSMQQGVVELFQREYVKYEFINRDKTAFPNKFDIRLRNEIKKMEELYLTKQEENFLKNKCGHFFKPTYIDFLKSYRYDSSEVGVIQKGEELIITITGYWYRTILWEVPLMALISELYFEMTGKKNNNEISRHKNNIEKGNKFHINGMKVADFGTRRRYSYDNQLEVVKDLVSCFDNGIPFFVGTSNVHIAMTLDITPIGTHAHEWVSGIASLKGYNYANKHMMDDWVKVYQGNLGIALTDTFGVDLFLKDFNSKHAKLFDGVRHDSGNPFEFADKIVSHYKKLGIYPLSKVIIFSDGLNTDLAIKIHKYCKEIGIMCSFGIGTHLTNDVGVKALNIVIKLISVNNNHAIKLSDIKGKHTGDKETIEIVKKLINY